MPTVTDACCFDSVKVVCSDKLAALVSLGTRAGVYQALPGPEATELACYFGLVAKGYFAAFLGGLGFITPGFLIMLLFSYIYGRFNLFANPVRESGPLRLF